MQLLHMKPHLNMQCRAWVPRWGDGCRPLQLRGCICKTVKGPSKGQK